MDNWTTFGELDWQSSELKMHVTQIKDKEMIDYPAIITEEKNGKKKTWPAWDAGDVISHVSAYVESGQCQHLHECEWIRINGSGSGFAGDAAAELAAWVEEWSEFESDGFSEFGSSPTEIAATITKKHGCDVVVTRDEYGWSVSDVQNAESEDEFWLRAYGESRGSTITVSDWDHPVFLP